MQGTQGITEEVAWRDGAGAKSRQMSSFPALRCLGILELFFRIFLGKKLDHIPGLFQAVGTSFWIFRRAIFAARWSFTNTFVTPIPLRSSRPGDLLLHSWLPDMHTDLFGLPFDGEFLHIWMINHGIMINIIISRRFLVTLFVFSAKWPLERGQLRKT